MIYVVLLEFTVITELKMIYIANWEMIWENDFTFRLGNLEDIKYYDPFFANESSELTYFQIIYVDQGCRNVIKLGGHTIVPLTVKDFVRFSICFPWKLMKILKT